MAGAKDNANRMQSGLLEIAEVQLISGKNTKNNYCFFFSFQLLSIFVTTMEWQNESIETNISCNIVVHSSTLGLS